MSENRSAQKVIIEAMCPRAKLRDEGETDPDCPPIWAMASDYT